MEQGYPVMAHKVVLRPLSLLQALILSGHEEAEPLRLVWKFKL